MTTQKKDQAFKLESDLCAAFLAEIPKDWQAYPETGGWDILLAHKTRNWQIGVEAKLKLNAKVLLQAAEGRWDLETGPDYRAVLIPDGTGGGELAALAKHCCLTVITMRRKQAWISPSFWPALPRPVDIRVTDASGDDAREWFEMMPTNRHRLPDYIPDVAAGVSSPVQLTRWKVSALRIAVLLDATGFVTRSDFKAQGIDIRRWIEGRWIVPGLDGFVPGPRMPEFRNQHPVVWDQVRADAAKWTRRQDVPLMVLPGDTQG